MRGFTLIELLVTLVIISILAAIGIPTYFNQVERARETELKILLASLALPIMEYRILNNKYPDDVHAGENPGLSEWPTEIPFNSVIDYEHWSIGGGRCAVMISHFGLDGIRTSPIHQRAGDVGSIVKINTDFIKTVSEYPCNNPVGSIR